MKLIRADEHLQSVHDTTVAFLETCPYEIVSKQGGPGTNFTLRAVYHRRPPDSLLLDIGDCLHNLRSALDHLAWSLAGSNADHSTEFPIFFSEPRFIATTNLGKATPGSGFHKMHDMPTGAQAIIESLQPYKGSHGLPPRLEPLWLLQQLDIEDKHHAFNLVAAGVLGNIHITQGHTATGLYARTGYLPLEDGAELANMPSFVSQSNVYDYSNFSFDVAFDPKGPAGGISLRDGLRDIREAVADAIQLLRPYI